MQIEVHGRERLNSQYEAEDGNEGGGGSREPAPGQGTVDLKAAHESARVDHQHAKADENGGESDAEGYDQEEPQAYAVQGKRTQENDERCRARDDAAGDTQGHELSEAYGLRRSDAALLRVTLRFIVRGALPEHPVSVRFAWKMCVIGGCSAQST